MCVNDDEWYDELRGVERLIIVLERSCVDSHKYANNEDSYYNPDA